MGVLWGQAEVGDDVANEDKTVHLLEERVAGRSHREAYSLGGYYYYYYYCYYYHYYHYYYYYYHYYYYRYYYNHHHHHHHHHTLSS